METAIRQRREERAEEILGCGRPIIKTPEGYRVPSMRDGNKYYLVTKRDGRVTCTCPDYANKISAEENGNGNLNGSNGNLQYCKHILSVFRAVKTGQIAVEKSPTAAILEYPFREDQIRQKNGRDYVEGAAIIQRMNDALGFDGWSFSILEVKQIEEEIIVRGQLTIYANGREIVKEQYGGHTLERNKTSGELLSRSDGLKSATTDCLKKLSTMLGIGLHLYSEGNRYQSFTSV